MLKQLKSYNNYIMKAWIKTKNIGLVIGILLVATLLSYAFSAMRFQEATIIIVYMLAVIIISQFSTHYIYGFFSSLLSVLAFNFFFTHPLFTFNISQPDYVFTFFMLFIASFLSSSLTAKLKREKQSSQMKTNQVLLMEAINHSFHIEELDKALYTSVNLISENSGAEVWLDCRWDNHDYQIHSHHTCRDAQNHYVEDLFLERQKIGTLCMVSDHGMQQTWVHILADLLSQNIERNDLVNKQALAKLQIREQKMRNDLLGAISHDLRTPLATIIGSSDTLLENLDKIDVKQQAELLNNIKNDGQWLLDSVENILSFMRIEEGSTLKMSLESVEELFGDVLGRMVHRIPQKLVLKLPNEPIYANMDIHLMGKVLLNLVDNAAKYAPPKSRIEMRAWVVEDRLIYEVVDEGPGIPNALKLTVFDRFTTVEAKPTNQRKGLGLGLAICKSIIEAHHGRIIIKDNQPSGTIFHCEFPYQGDQL